MDNLDTNRPMLFGQNTAYEQPVNRLTLGIDHAATAKCYVENG
jgi:hypothetical protein